MDETARRAVSCKNKQGEAKMTEKDKRIEAARIKFKAIRQNANFARMHGYSDGDLNSKETWTRRVAEAFQELEDARNEEENDKNSKTDSE